MPRVVGDIVIERPVDEVFAFVADQTNEPKYNPELIASEQLTDGPVGLGTRFRAVHAQGRRSSFTMEIELTAFDPPRYVGSRTRMAWAEITGGVSFEPHPDGTRMSWSWELHPKGAARLLGPFLGHLGDVEERAVWERMKRYLEAKNIARV